VFITELARRAGLPARTVRFYADERIIVPAQRTDGGYRIYDDAALRRLRFISRVQPLGLPLSEIKQLLRASEQLSCGRSSDAVRKRLARQLTLVDERLTALGAVRHELATLLQGPTGECSDDMCLCQTTAIPHH